MIFSMYVATIQHLSYTGQEFNKNSVYVSDTSVTLEQGQGHQPWYRLTDLKQGYYQAIFERHCLKSA